MRIHSKARPIISQLSMLSPTKKLIPNENWDIDLSYNTNPYTGKFSSYPNIKQNHLKELYLKRIFSINKPFSSQENNNNFSSENILFTAGSMEGIDLILRTFCEPNNDMVCIPSPSFFAYEYWALLHNLQVKKVPFFGEDLNQLNLEDVISINPKVIFLCDPNNPTGSKLKSDFIQKLCESLKGLVVVDEAYIEFSKQPSSIFHLHQYSNLIILRTFSKAWGLAGVRCGAIIADKSIIHALMYVQLPFSVSTPAQEEVEERLLNPKVAFDSWKRIIEERENLSHQLSSLKNIIKIFKSKSNFIMIVLKNFDQTLSLLKEHEIHVLDCSANYKDSIRVSIGTTEENQIFLDVMRKVG